MELTARERGIKIDNSFTYPATANKLMSFQGRRVPQSAMLFNFSCKQKVEEKTPLDINISSFRVLRQLENIEISGWILYNVKFTNSS